jgi:hypothetical protein
MKGMFKMKSKSLILLAIVALAGFLPQSKASLVSPVSLGSARSFAVLAGFTVTSTGSTTLKGDLGLWPGNSVTETPAMTVSGTRYINDGVAQTAQGNLITAYNNAAGRPYDKLYDGGYDLGLGGTGQTLTPGVYRDGTSFLLTGTLTLDAEGNPDAVWIFQAGSTLTTAAGAPGNPGSSVVLINGAQACHVFWQVGSSATLGMDSDFVGNILALASITANTGAKVDGRLLALNGVVTLDNNTITVPTCIPEASTFWPGACCASLFAWQWLIVWRRKAARS